MAKFSLAGFKDPARRPRYTIWAGVVVLLVIVVMVLALGVTSSRWFCSEGCHKVQDDTIISYSHSSHSRVSCLACHMPANSDPVTFLFHKVESLGELYLTVSNKYELPLNKGDRLALDKTKMASAQCTQCHNLATRVVNPSPGIIISHDVHAKNGIQCTMCHNRVAHNEDFALTLPGNRKHVDFMKMQACFRCHTLTPGSRTDLGLTATGKCSACHTADFALKPPNHADSAFYPKGHAKLATSDPKYCTMCHVRQAFCDKCHGLPMPHPADFIKTHGPLGKSKPQMCLRCHGTKAGGFEFCNACHHRQGDPNKPWIPQHSAVVKANGASSCLGDGSPGQGCHNPVFCSNCHVSGIVRQK